MEVTPDNQLLFADDLDYDFLDRFRWSLVSPSMRPFVEAIEDDIADKTGSSMFSGPYSYSELKELIKEQELTHLRNRGISCKPDSNIVLAISRARQSDIVYSLSPKWVPAVLAEALILGSTVKEERNELLKLMIDGQTLEAEAEAMIQGRPNPSQYPEVDLMFAQDDFNVARRAGEIALQLIETLDLL